LAQLPRWPEGTWEQVPLLHCWHGPVQSQHWAFEMQTLLPQSRGAFAGQTQVLLAESHEV
jgi:hypothetical protein